MSTVEDEKGPGNEGEIAESTTEPKVEEPEESQEEQAIREKFKELDEADAIMAVKGEAREVLLQKFQPGENDVVQPSAVAKSVVSGIKRAVVLNLASCQQLMVVLKTVEAISGEFRPAEHVLQTKEKSKLFWEDWDKIYEELNTRMTDSYQQFLDVNRGIHLFELECATAVETVIKCRKSIAEGKIIKESDRNFLEKFSTSLTEVSKKFETSVTAASEKLKKNGDETVKNAVDLMKQIAGKGVAAKYQKNYLDADSALVLFNHNARKGEDDLNNKILAQQRLWIDKQADEVKAKYDVEMADAKHKRALVKRKAAGKEFKDASERVKKALTDFDLAKQDKEKLTKEHEAWMNQKKKDVEEAKRKAEIAKSALKQARTELNDLQSKYEQEYTDEKHSSTTRHKASFFSFGASSTKTKTWTERKYDHEAIARNRETTKKIGNLRGKIEDLISQAVDVPDVDEQALAFDDAALSSAVQGREQWQALMEKRKKDAKQQCDKADEQIADCEQNRTKCKQILTEKAAAAKKEDAGYQDLCVKMTKLVAEHNTKREALEENKRKAFGHLKQLCDKFGQDGDGQMAIQFLTHANSLRGGMAGQGRVLRTMAAMFTQMVDSLKTFTTTTTTVLKQENDSALEEWAISRHMKLENLKKAEIDDPFDLVGADKEDIQEVVDECGLKKLKAKAFMKRLVEWSKTDQKEAEKEWHKAQQAAALRTLESFPYYVDVYVMWWYTKAIHGACAKPIQRLVKNEPLLMIDDAKMKQVRDMAVPDEEFEPDPELEKQMITSS